MAWGCIAADTAAAAIAAEYLAYPSLMKSPSRRIQSARRILRVLATPPETDLGPGTLTVSVIHCGHGLNIVPDACTVAIDRRVVAGEEPSRVPVFHFVAQEKPVRQSPTGLSGSRTTSFS